MFVVGLAVSEFSLRIRTQAVESRAREERTAALYALSRDLGGGLTREQVAAIVALHASDTFDGGAAVFLAESGMEAPCIKSGAEIPWGSDEQHAVVWAFEHGKLAGLGTRTVPEARIVCAPLRSGLGLDRLGVLALAPRAGLPLSLEQRHFIDAFARQAALALEHARLSESAQSAALRARTEELRSSLLSSVSHDLRTPLAAITGAATTLRDGLEGLQGEQRRELLDTVCEEAERLDLLVRNLLDMTQLESGTLQVKREWVPLEEIVGSALGRFAKELAGRPIHTELAADLPLVAVDPVLLEQVFLNLLENARKYTPEKSPIEVVARAQDDATVIEVADRGPGPPEGGEERIFDMFFRGQGNDAPGAGLGLAICRGILAAHGGTIGVERRPGGGSVFRITLPREGEAPEVPGDSAAPLEREESSA